MSNTSSSNNKTNLYMNMREFGSTSVMTDLRHMLGSFVLFCSLYVSSMQLVLHKITTILFIFISICTHTHTSTIWKWFHAASNEDAFC